MSKFITFGLLAFFIVQLPFQTHAMEYVPKIFKTKSFWATVGAATAFSATVYAINYWQDGPNRAFYQAVYDGNVEQVRRLFTDDIDYKRRAKDGKNLLHYVVLSGHYDIARMFARDLILINQEDMYGHSPLYYALQNRDNRMALMLRRAGANYYCTIDMTEDLKKDLDVVDLILEKSPE